MSHAFVHALATALRRVAGAGAVLASTAVVSTAAAQSVMSSIVGTVHDQQHGVLPGVAVAVKNLDTGQARSTTSSDTGTFDSWGSSPVVTR